MTSSMGVFDVTGSLNAMTWAGFEIDSDVIFKVANNKTVSENETTPFPHIIVNKGRLSTIKQIMLLTHIIIQYTDQSNIFDFNDSKMISRFMIVLITEVFMHKIDNC